MVQPLAVVAAWVLIAGDEVYRHRGRHLLRPFRTLDEVVQLDEIPHQLQRRVEGVERVARVVGDDVGVHGYPVRGAVRVLDAVGHAEEHLSEPLSGGLIRVGGDGGADGRIIVFYLAALELAYQPAEHESGEVIAVERGVGAAEHRAPAVPEYEEREVGVGHVRDVVQVFFIPQIGHVAAGVRVAEGAAVEAGLAVADVVVGVPDSGLDAALGYSQESGIPYGIGFIKNKYIGRTFIQGSQKQRENSVRIKLNVVSSTVKGKRVVLVDDSIVRGTTSARIIKLLRDAGAAEVHFMVSAPPFKYPCYFGTDIPDQKLLVATGRTLEQINEIIGADTLGYLSNEHVVQLAKNAKCGFCTACFTGEYAVEPESVLSTDIHDRHLNDRPKDAKKLGE